MFFVIYKLLIIVMDAVLERYTKKYLLVNKGLINVIEPKTMI